MQPARSAETSTPGCHPCCDLRMHIFCSTCSKCYLRRMQINSSKQAMRTNDLSHSSPSRGPSARRAPRWPPRSPAPAGRRKEREERSLKQYSCQQGQVGWMDASLYAAAACHPPPSRRLKRSGTAASPSFEEGFCPPWPAPPSSLRRRASAVGWKKWQGVGEAGHWRGGA